MTPYLTGCKAILDPTIGPSQFSFGKVDKKYLKATCVIVDQKYCKPKLTQIYGVQFSDKVTLWFEEKELIAFTR